MQTHFVRFPTHDKLILQGLVYAPDSPTSKVILHIHGMAGNFYENRFLDFMAPIFTNAGWAFFCPNTRGHDYIADFPVVGGGKDRRIGNAYETFAECVHDIEGAIDWLTQAGYKTIILQGHSLGAPKVIYYTATTQDKRISKLILLSPADMVGLAEADKNYARWTQDARDLVAQGKEEEFLPDRIWVEPEWDGYILSAHTYLDLTQRDNPVDIINTYDKGKGSLLNQIRIPTLALFGSEDDAAIMPIQEALDVIKQKAKHCPQFDTDIIEGAPHTYAGQEQAIAEKIKAWLD